MNDYNKTQFPETDAHIRIAMIGMVPGNGHPYSWSAIINGYDKAELSKCPYPAIPKYMAQQDESSSGLDGATVTHIWTDDTVDASKVAAATRIGNILDHPEEAIGRVDVVIIASDDGDRHVDRAKPFIEAGVPVFIDKPLATNLKDLNWFIEREKEGYFFMSSSGLRYAPELQAPGINEAALGEIIWASSFGIKNWETYGIHSLESLYQLTGPGLEEVCCREIRNGIVATITHKRGIVLTIPMFVAGTGSFGTIHVCGTRGCGTIQMVDTYAAFRNQLRAFIEGVRCREPEFNHSETYELMRAIIAGKISMEMNGKPIKLETIR